VSKSALKPGWRMVKFGEIVHNANLTERKPVDIGLDRVVGLEHLDPENLHISRWNDIADGTSFTRKFIPGQTLFGKRRAYQRKVAYAEFTGICSGDILTFESKDPKELLPELLPFIVQSDGFFNYALGTSAGSLSPRTSWKALQSYEFPLPPIEEQRLIAEILWAADEAVEGVVAAQKTLKKARRVSLFHLMAEGLGPDFRGITRFGLKDGAWNVCRIEKAGKVQLGRQRAPKYQSGKFTRSYLRVANVYDGRFDLSDILEMDFNERDYAKYKLEPGDILLNEGQSRELVGRCALFSGEIDECCFQNTLIRFQVRQGLKPEFAFRYFQYLYYRLSFSAVGRQTTSMAHLGADTFSRMFMPVPSVAEQECVIEVMNGFSKSHQQMEIEHQNATKMRHALCNDLTGGTNV
jgi:type I restriction enzyme, S subunit